MREINIISSGNKVTVRWETSTTVCTETGVKLYEDAEEPSALQCRGVDNYISHNYFTKKMKFY